MTKKEVLKMENIVMLLRFERSEYSGLSHHAHCNALALNIICSIRSLDGHGCARSDVFRSKYGSIDTRSYGFNDAVSAKMMPCKSVAIFHSPLYIPVVHTLCVSLMFEIVTCDWSRSLHIGPRNLPDLRIRLEIGLGLSKSLGLMHRTT
jgi:hypothetical protein